MIWLIYSDGKNNINSVVSIIISRRIGMAKNIWKDYELEKKIIRILKEIKYKKKHHFGRPFITPYQIAVEFEKNYPDDFKGIGVDIGGKGIGKRTSFAQYIARQLSQKIKNIRVYNIEGSFISDRNLKEISFKDNLGKKFSSSLTGSGWDLSLFRYRNTK